MVEDIFNAFSISLAETSLSVIAAWPVEFVLDISSPEIEIRTSFIFDPDCFSIFIKQSEIEEAVAEIFITEPFLTPEVSMLEKALILGFDNPSIIRPLIFEVPRSKKHII
jgi:hypothetical protein